jgi:hypothetical protein
MATVKKKIVKASVTLKRGGTVKKAQFGNTTPKGSCGIGKSNEKADNAETRKANRLASMSDSRRERVEARMDRREERKADREERRNTPRSERSSRGPSFGFKTGGTIKKSVVPKAQKGRVTGKGASAVSSQSNCKGGDCRKTEEDMGNRARGPVGFFEKMRDNAELKRFNKADRAEFDRQYAARDTSGTAARSAKFKEEEAGRVADAAMADRMSSQRNKTYPYRESNKIYDSLQNVRKTRPVVGPSTSASGSEGKSTGEYIMGKYKKGGKLKKTGSKLVKKASSRSMKMGGTIKKTAVKKLAVKKAVVKKTIKSKSKKK